MNTGDKEIGDNIVDKTSKKVDNGRMVRTNIVEKELLWLPNGEDEIVDDCVAH
jgi:hypothetical protein